MPNRLWYLDRATLEIRRIDLPGMEQPKMELVDDSPAFVRILDTRGGVPYNMNRILTLPVFQMVAVALENNYDTVRNINEAVEISVDFGIPPYLHTPVDVSAKIGPVMVANLPTVRGFPIRRVKPDPATVTIAAGKFYIWARNFAMPPQGGVRGIAWALDVARILVPEMISR